MTPTIDDQAAEHAAEPKDLTGPLVYLQPGDLVDHDVFGPGLVLRREPWHKALINFGEEHGRKEIVLAYAPMQLDRVGHASLSEIASSGWVPMPVNYPGFTGEDFHRLDLAGDPLPKEMMELRARGLVERTYWDHERYHDVEGGYRHPWCMDCGRWDLPTRWFPDGDGRVDERKYEERLKSDALNRVRSYLVMHGGRIPDDTAHKTRLNAPQDATNGLAADILDRATLATLPGVQWLIDGILPRDSYSLLAGRDGTKKTFVGLDWSLCVAAGHPWHGQPVEAGRVLYIAAEGAAGIAARVHAWEQAQGVEVAPEAFTVLPRAVNLRTGAEVPALLDLIREREITLVVGDTLHRLSGGADEIKGMGPILHQLDEIKRATNGGSVLVLAHTGKTDDDTRGSSAIEDDADVVWRTQLDSRKRLRLFNHKMKDAPDGAEYWLTAQPWGESLVLTPAAANPQDAAGEDPPKRLNDSDRLILDALGRYAGRGATRDEVIDASGVSRATVYRRLPELVTQGLVRETGEGHFIATNDRLTPVRLTAIST